MPRRVSLLTVSQVAAFWGVSRSYVYACIGRGMLRTVWRRGRIRVPVSEALRHLHNAV